MHLNPLDIFVILAYVAASVGVGIAWQTALTAAPIFLVIQDFPKMWMTLGVVAACSV